MTKIRKLIEERATTHGNFSTNALLEERLLRAIEQNSCNWGNLDPVLKYALRMDIHKLVRMLNGDAEHMDHWIDRIGYLQLAVDHLERMQAL